jgi:D-xylose transport system substrate-binding protein
MKIEKMKRGLWAGTRKHYFAVVLVWLLVLNAVGITACGRQETSGAAKEGELNQPIEIGMCFDAFILERWLRDRDVFVSTASELGAEVNVQNANGDKEEQLKQIQYLVDKNVDAIVVVGVDTGDDRLGKLMLKAKEKEIVTVCYDRLIQNANADLFISVDSRRVGELMAETVLGQISPEGKIAAIFGPDTDTNVSLLRQGVDSVLQTHGKTLSYENEAADWKEEYAFEYMKECLVTVGPVEGVICANDGLASMAFQALSESQAADGVCIVGQDADILACQRIVEGYQYMTVYKPINDLAKRAAQYTIDLIKGKEVLTDQQMNDGTYDIPYARLDPVAVTKENMDRIILDSSFHLREEVYLHISK